MNDPSKLYIQILKHLQTNKLCYQYETDLITYQTQELKIPSPFRYFQGNYSFNNLNLFWSPCDKLCSFGCQSYGRDYNANSCKCEFLKINYDFSEANTLRKMSYDLQQEILSCFSLSELRDVSAAVKLQADTDQTDSVTSRSRRALNRFRCPAGYYNTTFKIIQEVFEIDLRPRFKNGNLDTDYAPQLCGKCEYGCKSCQGPNTCNHLNIFKGREVSLDFLLLYIFCLSFFGNKMARGQVPSVVLINVIYQINASQKR